MAKEQKRALGTGLGALLGNPTNLIKTDGTTTFSEIEIERIKPNSNQPRTKFDDEALEDLSISIKNLGVIQPITVRKMEDGTFQIIAGERRFRASKKAGLTKIPAYIRDADEKLVQQMALVENIQREDLNAIEVALAYKALIDNHNYTQETLSEIIGKNRATIANYLRLLRLPAEIQLAIKEKELEMGHARAIVSIEDVEKQLEIFHQIKTEKLSVREVEQLAKKNQQKGNCSNKKKNKPSLSKRQEEIQNNLSNHFSSQVELSCTKNGKGKISISFTSNNDLERIVQLLNK